MKRKRFELAAAVAAFAASTGTAQIGGNGSDGPFTPTANAVLTADASNGGVFQFTTVFISAGVTVECAGSLPVQIFSMGDIVVDAAPGSPPGRIVADGAPGGPGTPGVFPYYGPGGIGKNGGFSGGHGGCHPFLCGSQAGTPGMGPGGGPGGSLCCGLGSASGGGFGTAGFPSPGGGVYPAFGSSTAVAPDRGPQGIATPTQIEFATDRIGGSGGGGGYGCCTTEFGGGGGAGGGCIVLSAAGNIVVDGILSAVGGQGGAAASGPGLSPGDGGGGGSGGAILLRAGTSVSLSPAGIVTTAGGLGGPAGGSGTSPGGNGGMGRVRFESPPGALTVAGTVVGVVSTGVPPPPAQTTTSTQILFGGTPATSVTLAGVHSLSALAPPRPPGWVDVTISDPLNSIRLPHAFAYLPALEASLSGGAVTGGSVTVTLTSTQFHWETVYVGLVLLPAPIALPPIGYVQWIDGLIAPVLAGLNPNATGVVATNVPFAPNPALLGMSVYLQGIDVVTPFPLIATLTNPVSVTF